jgi:hypothetical protein
MRTRRAVPTLRHAILAVAVVFAVPPTAAAVTRAALPGATAHASAYRNQPPIAYISGGHVFVLDGKGHRPRAIDPSAGACCVAWAPDGAHIAFQRGAELWISAADGSAARRVAPTVLRWAWSSDGEAIAAIPNPTRTGDGTGIDFYAVDEPRAHVTLLRGYHVLDFAWAGLGRRVAVSALPPPGAPGVASTGAALFMLEVPGPYGDCAALCPEPAQPVAIDGPANGGLNVYFARWSPDLSNLVVWTEPAGAGPSPGSLELSLFSPAGGPTTPLARTLVDRSWIQWSKAGDRLLVVEGSGPDAAASHVLDLCVPPLGCRALNGPGVSVVDPAWSDDGRMAYVAAAPAVAADPSRGGPLNPDGRLWVADGDGQHARVVTSGGVATPGWLPDARHLVFVRDQTLWLLDADRGGPVPIAGPLSRAPAGSTREPSDPFRHLEDGDPLFAVAP